MYIVHYILVRYFTSHVHKNTKVSENWFELQFILPPNIKAPQAGQFISVGLENYAFRKPFAISSYQTKTRVCAFLYTVRGKGTAEMSMLTDKHKINLMCFHGNFFSIPQNTKRNISVVLVGGGTGLGPLLYFAHVLLEKKIQHYINFYFYAGFSTGKIIPQTLFKPLLQKTPNIYICTDDGTKGYHGSCLDALQDTTLAIIPPNVIYYFCGPHKMMKAGVLYTKKQNVLSYISLDSVMACCTGACMGCVVPTTDKKPAYVRVCKEGPIFNSKDIML